MQEQVSKHQIASTDLVFCTQKTFTWSRAYETEAFGLDPPILAIPDLLQSSCLKYFRNLADGLKEYTRIPLRNSNSWFEFIPERSKSEKSDWFILRGEVERGPFLMSELEEFLAPAENLDWVYVWRPDMVRWKSIGILPQFNNRVTEQTHSMVFDPQDDGALELGRNLRANQRTFVTAHVVLHKENNQRQMLGICTNISLSGFQIILDRSAFQFPERSVHSLEIRPVRLSGLLPFKVEASLRWNEAGKKMGFKIEEMSEMDQVLFNLYLSKISV